MSGIDRIAKERQRQMDSEGWSPDHDDMHDCGELAQAALCYVAYYLPDVDMPWWPWEARWWKPAEDEIRNLEKAGALIAAEIDRLEREGA